jgi:hypothetical protein
VQSAILEKPISVAARDTPALVALQAALDDLRRASGEKVSMTIVPFNLLRQPIRVTASNQPAYEVLSQLFAAVDRRVPWQLLYDVNVKTYFVNIYRAYE